MQIGITGGIGSGKSLVSKIFHCLGIPVYDADSRAKNLMTTDGILISQIKKEFGALSYHEDGTLNRSYISEVVFSNSERLDVLNKLVHPRVAENYFAWVNAHSDSPYLLKEAALLYESNSFKELDKVIVVNSPDTLRIERILKRDPQRSENQVRDIIRSQMPEDEKLKRADFVIRNNESDMVIPQVLEIHNKILGDSEPR
jgi:dephospho-CoA kinase